MSVITFGNVRLAGISAAVPANIERNVDIKTVGYDALELIESTGIHERRVSREFTASDLGYAAAENLISDLGWDKRDIDVLIFVSQHPDYILPATACVLQARLGLSKECYALDISMGCSGWVYGLSTVASLLSTGVYKKALLLVGDAKKRVEPQTIDPLFGYAGTATALEYSEGESGFTFHMGTDGSGYEAIIIPDGGARNQITPKSFELEEIDGKQYHRLQTRMNGMDVFAFAIMIPPKSIRKVLEVLSLDVSDVDYLILHQANKMINEKIRTKLKMTEDQTLSSLQYFGNTSSASIPLTICTQLRVGINRRIRFVCCGFGVGLSWGTVSFETTNLIISDLIEL